MGFFTILRIAFVGLISVCFLGPAEAWAKDLTVFAAASLKESLDDVAAAFTAATGTTVVTSYAGSSALARQIELGAPADIFISANPEWMDRLEETQVIDPTTRVDLLGNRLVLIGAGSDAAPVELTAQLDLAAMLGGGKLAMALTDAVPAGVYGKAALQSLGLWTDISAHVVQTDNVRAALALVALRAAPFGIVYATDAQAEPRVDVLAVFPQNTHPVITYPVAATTGARQPQAAAFLDYLRGDTADGIFTDHGFVTQRE